MYDSDSGGEEALDRKYGNIDGQHIDHLAIGEEALLN